MVQLLREIDINGSKILQMILKKLRKEDENEVRSFRSEFNDALEKFMRTAPEEAPFIIDFKGVEHLCPAVQNKFFEAVRELNRNKHDMIMVNMDRDAVLVPMRVHSQGLPIVMTTDSAKTVLDQIGQKAAAR